VDTLIFCLSNSVGEPAGSILAGARKLIDIGLLLRKLLVGVMRQAGVLAAAGLLALEDTPKRLPADHENAKHIARILSGVDGIRVFPVETNIVVFDVAATGRTPAQISAALKNRGVLINGINDRLMRAVTHYDVSREQCAEAMRAFVDAVGAERAFSAHRA
jgi:threonine aldolase